MKALRPYLSNRYIQAYIALLLIGAVLVIGWASTATSVPEVQTQSAALLNTTFAYATMLVLLPVMVVGWLESLLPFTIPQAQSELVLVLLFIVSPVVWIGIYRAVLIAINYLRKNRFS